MCKQLEQAAICPSASLLCSQPSPTRRRSIQAPARPNHQSWQRAPLDRPVVQSRKLSEAVKEKLDAVWADAIYATALPLNLLDHPSIRTASNTTADLVRTLGPLGVPRRFSEIRCCRGGL